VGAGCGVADRVRPTAVGADQWRLTVVVDDALNLPIGAPVKVRGLVVGTVVAIEPEDYRARVGMAIDDEVELSDRSRFALRYTTALGELYVDVDPGPPAAGRAAAAARPLGDGDVVSGPAATTSATVEDTLASASLLVNGGGLGQVQTIVSELNTAFGGRAGAARALLSRTDTFLAEALASTREIDGLLRALDGAARTLDEREATVDAALRDLRPAARALDRNTAGLVRLLRRSDRLAVVADRLVRGTRTDLVRTVDELGPVLEEVLSIRDELVPGLDLLADFGRKADTRAPTEYLNLKFQLDLTSRLLGQAAGAGDDTGDGTRTPGRPTDQRPPGAGPALPAVPDLPLLDGLLPELGGGSEGPSLLGDVPLMGQVLGALSSLHRGAGR
jgi:phospholipid/cholesterol/gamma-HCH transport system substrate-binding protein